MIDTLYINKLLLLLNSLVAVTIATVAGFNIVTEGGGDQIKLLHRGKANGALCSNTILLL